MKKAFVQLFLILIFAVGCEEDNPERIKNLVFTPAGMNPVITVTSPSYGDSYDDDTNTIYILWNSTGSISSVKIELYQNSTCLFIISSPTSNDGSYDLNYYNYPSFSYSGSNEYRIKITDVSNSSVYDYSAYFTIDE